MQSLEENNTDLSKAIGLPVGIDPDHEYIYRSGEYGIYQYWYKDQASNYWRYTNAPEDHSDYDPRSGVSLIFADQPMPHTAPEFYTEEGKKRHIAVEEGTLTEVNPYYSPESGKHIWYELYKDEESIQYVYLDSDIRENLDLWVQHQLRVVDVGLKAYRNVAANMFHRAHPKDRVLGTILMLVDQCFYSVEELLEATVDDIEFIDNAVKLLGKKFVCDPKMLDFLTSLVGTRDASDPLFVVQTVHGLNPLGKHHVFSVFSFLRISPNYLRYWHASQMFSRIMNRLASQEVPEDEIEDRAFSELSKVFYSATDIRYMVDYKVRDTLVENYKGSVQKSIKRQNTDDLGVTMLWSDLVDLRGDEQEFSAWLHAEPLHDTSPEEEAEIAEFLAEKEEAVETPDEPTSEEQAADAEQPSSPGASPTPDAGDGPNE